MLNAMTLNGPAAAALPEATLRAAVAAALAGDATVSAYVGDRVTYGMMSQARANDACGIAYQVVSLTRPTALDNPLTIQQARVQVAIASTNALDVEDAAEATRRLFHGFTGTLAGTIDVKECRLDAERDLPQEPVDGSDRWTHRTVLDLMIRYVEARP
jgi:hypothetical protein